MGNKKRLVCNIRGTNIMSLRVGNRFKNKYIIIASIIAVILIVSVVITVGVKADANVGVKYRVHVAYNGWLDWKTDGQTAGTVGESRRMEAMKLKLEGNVDGSILYNAFVGGIGWTNEVSNGALAGVEGQSKQIEAIKIRLEGNIAQSYDVNYRVHIKNGGWQEWVSNGAVAGSETFGLRVEAIEIKLVAKESGETGVSYDNVIDSTVTQVVTSSPEQPTPEQNTQPEQPVPEQNTQPEQTAPVQENTQQQEQVQAPVQEPSNNTTSQSPFHKYTDLTETQLKGLARLCQQEQGTAKGAAAEASLMANHMDLRQGNAKKYSINGQGLYDYVRYGKWFAHAAKWMDKQDPRADVLEAVRKVLVEGKRTLPGYINEHDCFSDISSATNNGSAISVKNRGSYVQHTTYIKNRYGGNYTFYCFPTESSDPFGYTSKTKRQEIGDFCYKFEDL
jgi:uncharacterized protein YjdB